MAEPASEGRHAWLTKHLPTEESLRRHRLLRPLAPHLGHPALWRLHRRSVPRGVAVGLFVGLIFPVMHTVLAALVAVPVRANIAVAAAATLIVNPLTMPPIYYFAYRVGWWELHHNAPLIASSTAQQVSGELGRVLFWLHEASGPIAIGVVTLAVAAAVVGYALSAISWRWWLGSKRRERRQASLQPPQ